MVIPYSDLANYLLILMVLLGLVALTLGGDWLCKGASSLASLLKINPVVIGLTVVSIATSAPELFTAMIATSKGNSDLALGNIVGSNLGNIGLIMGIAAIVYPVRIQRRLINKEMPVLLAATLVFTAFSLTGYEIGRLEGVFLFIAMGGYLIFLSREARKMDDVSEITEEIPEPVRSVTLCLFLVLVGSISLWLGAELLVNSAVELAVRLNVSQVLIGITVVAIGTSLPELGASLAAAFRRQSDICAGNIIGSNLFNILFVGGGVTAIFPIQVDDALFQVEFPAMLLLTALLWLIFITDRRVTRLEGSFLVILYCLIIAMAAMSHSGNGLF